MAHDESGAEGRRGLRRRKAAEMTASSEPLAAASDRTGVGDERGARLAPSQADIARRAYELYRARGGRDGNDVQDWLQAERELRGR